MNHAGRFAFALTAGVASLAAALTGCNASRNGADAYAPATEAARNPLEAQRLTAEAVTIMQDDPAKAEALLRRALAADLFHGPAHNNLGVLMLTASRPSSTRPHTSSSGPASSCPATPTLSTTSP